MAIWDKWIDNWAIKRTKEQIVSRFWPLWDTGALQYPTQNPYVLANEGFTKNELIYACINRIAGAVAEAPLWIYDDSGETPEEVPDHPMRRLLRHPAKNVTEEDFWKITEIFLKVAGFCVWEKIRNKMGQVVELGLMRPDWISFKRGGDRMIDAVTYSPPGYNLPAKDADEFIILMYFDPRNPLSKGLSPTAIAMRMSSVDNSATDFLKLFFQHGAMFNGLITTEQKITPQTADKIRDDWKIKHGGVQNWSDIAVLGYGAKFQEIQMDFQQMAFDSLDSRSEARICTVFNIPPIVVGTLTGLAAGTHHNYEEAKLAFYQDNIKPEWRFLAGQFREQLLPEFEGEQWEDFDTQFYVGDIASLQPNRTDDWDRAGKGYDDGLIARDEAREEMDKDPIDGDWLKFKDGTKKPKPGLDHAPVDDTTTPGSVTAGPVTGEATNGAPVTTAAPLVADTPAVAEAKSLERRKFHAFAMKRIKRPDLLAQFHFDWLAPREQSDLIAKYRSGRKGVSAPRVFTRILILNSFEGSHPDADEYWRREVRKVADICMKRMPTEMAFIRQPTDLEAILSKYDPRDTLLIDWTDSEASSQIVETLGFAHTSSSAWTQKLIFDREQTFIKLKAMGVRVPAYAMISQPGDFAPSESLNYPVIVRPNEAHGSEDMCVVESPDEMQGAFEKIVASHKAPYIVQEYVSPAREFSVGLWSDGRSIDCFPIAEADFNGLADDVKGEDDKAELGPSANRLNQVAVVSPEVEQRLVGQSRQIFREFGIRLYARVDWRMYTNDNDPVCIDPNCEPEMTEPSLMALMAQWQGLTYEQFVLSLVDRAISYYYDLDFPPERPASVPGPAIEQTTALSAAEKSALTKEFRSLMKEVHEAIKRPA